MLLVSPTGETRLLDDAQSPPLDGGDGQDRRQASVVLEPGSLLVLYSDGLVERRGEPLRAGLERLREAGGALAGAPAEVVCDRLVAALGVESSRADDVAVLAVRLTAAGFHLVFPARAEKLRELRAALRAWLAARGAGSHAQNALLLAVGEACANAIEHAYRDRDPGDVSVDITEGEDHALRVVVSDSGTSTPPRRARIAAAARTSCAPSPRTSPATRRTAGTTVRFRLPVENPTPA